MTWISIAFAAFVLLLLAGLHALSPEFDPSWRVVSEYANGHYGWVLSLMFACWAISSWALAFSVSPYLRTRVGKIGLWFLIFAGAGEALASAFDINQPLHGLAGLLGAGGLPVAAVLISVALRRTQPSLRYDGALLWASNLTWIVVVAMIASLAVMFVTYIHSGGQVPSNGKPLPLGTQLPAGVIAVAGYMNRLLVVVNCAWAIVAAARVSALNRQNHRALSVDERRVDESVAPRPRANGATHIEMSSTVPSSLGRVPLAMPAGAPSTVAITLNGTSLNRARQRASVSPVPCHSASVEP
jgi:hypothetical protein